MKSIFPVVCIVVLASSLLSCGPGPEKSARTAWNDLVEERYREKPAFRYIENDPSLPNVLLYGDSISMGYTPEVRRQLEAVANVYRIHKNGAFSASVIPKLEELHKTMRDPHLDAPWDFDWDVIHFNAGIHDLTYLRADDGKRDKVNGQLRTPISDYKENLEAIIAYLRELAPEAKLIFATTTPIPENEPGRKAGDGARYNEAALEVLSKHRDIIINDLHAFTLPHQPDWWSEPGNVHFNSTGYTALGVQVARTIRSALGKDETIQLEGETIKISPKKAPPTLRDVAYGPHERNKLDFWKAESDEPTPLVFYIHGGGWIGGSKEANKRPFLNLLDQGVSYVSINYRLADGKDGNILPCSLHDAARALQFVRSKAEEWNIDPEKIIATGGSAGGCSSLWLAYHDDLAAPESDDPVERQSTRILGAAVIKAQSTIDPVIVDQRLGPSASNHEMIWRTVGAPSREALFENLGKYQPLAIECSPLTYVSADDPPVFAVYGEDTPAPPENDGIHHVEFGRILKEKCDELGLDCTIEIHGKDSRQQAIEAFMMERFEVPQVLYEDDFEGGLSLWVAEQQKDGFIEIRDGKLRIFSPAGSTVWFKHKLEGPVMIEYTATMVDEGGPHDRVSDLNCFWMAIDPDNPDDLFADTERGGSFGNYHPLRLYYVGYGANDNTTTRFRRYPGGGERPLLPEHDLKDKKFMNTPNQPIHIQIVADGSTIQFFRDGEVVYDIHDPEPFTEGWFAFRTVRNHMTIDDFRVYRLQRFAFD